MVPEFFLEERFKNKGTLSHDESLVPDSQHRGFTLGRLPWRCHVSQHALGTPELISIDLNESEQLHEQEVTSSITWRLFPVSFLSLIG